MLTVAGAGVLKDLHSPACDSWPRRRLTQRFNSIPGTRSLSQNQHTQTRYPNPGKFLTGAVETYKSSGCLPRLDSLRSMGDPIYLSDLTATSTVYIPGQRRILDLGKHVWALQASATVLLIRTSESISRTDGVDHSRLSLGFRWTVRGRWRDPQTLRDYDSVYSGLISHLESTGLPFPTGHKS